MSTGLSDQELAGRLGPVRRIPAHAENVDLSASTSPAVTTTELDGLAGEYVYLLAVGGDIGVTIAASASGIAYAECLPIEDGKFQEIFLSSEDVDTGLVYVADSGTPTLRVMRAKPYSDGS